MRAVGVIDGERLVGLVAVDGEPQELERGVLARGEADGLPGGADDIVGAGGADGEGGAIPGLAGPEQVGGEGGTPPSRTPVVRVNVEPSLTMPSRLNEPPRFTGVNGVAGLAETSFDLPLSPTELTAVTS